MYEDEDLQEIHEDIQELDADISILRKDLNNISATVTGTGENVTLNQTAEARFKKPPLPMGNSEQVQYSGKNLAGPIQGNITSAGITIQATDKSISINGTATDDSTFQLVGETITRPSKYFQGLVLNEQNSIKISAGTYILSSNETGLLKFYGNLGDNLGSCTSITAGTAFTITEDKYVWLGIYISSGVAINKTIDNLQLEQGSTASSFEPYVGGTVSPNPDYPQEIENVTGDVEVVVENKNLIDINNPMFRNTILRQWGSAIGVSNVSDVSQYIKVIPNTQYTLSLETADSNYRRICFYKQPLLREEEQEDNTRFINYAEYSGNTKTFTTPNECNYIRIAYYNSVLTIQLEKGSTFTNYVEHKQQTFTFPLGNEKLMLGDYLADDGIHKNRKKIVLDGTSENKFSSFSTGANNRGVITAFSDIKKGVDFRYNTALCTNFAYVPNVYFDSGDTEGFIVDSTGTIYVRFGSQSEINTLAKANQWLANTLPELEYELAEETIIPYTPAQQEVYNQIKQALSYDEQTNVSSNTIALFTVKAFKNMNTSIESLQSRIELLKGRS